MDSVPVRLFILLIITAVIAFMRSAENSIKEANEARFGRLAEEGDKKAKRVMYLIKNYSSIYSMFSIFITVGQIFGASYIVVTKYQLFETSPWWALALGELIYVLVQFIFGMYIPKKIALSSPDSISVKLSGTVTVIYKFAYPVIKLLTLTAKGIMHLFGIKYRNTEDDITEEEIKLMVDIGSKSGAIDPEEKEMIHNIFEMSETPANDIMTHRTDIDVLWIEDSVEVWEKTISKGKHSVYPVCGETADEIIGLVNSKDFYRKYLRDKSFNVKSILRTPVFVPGTVKVDELFKKMQQSKTHFVVVLDEYGGVAGVITISDILEEIVGSIEEQEEPDIIKKEDNTWIINGTADLDEVEKTLGTKLPVEEYNTFAGLILSQMGTIPEDGTKPELEAYGLRIQVIKINERRIEKTRVSVLERDAAK